MYTQTIKFIREEIYCQSEKEAKAYTDHLIIIETMSAVRRSLQKFRTDTMLNDAAKQFALIILDIAAASVAGDMVLRGDAQEAIVSASVAAKQAMATRESSGNRFPLPGSAFANTGIKTDVRSESVYARPYNKAADEYMNQNSTHISNVEHYHCHKR
jgi:hypothetical protein